MQPSAACRGLYERSNHGGLLSRVNLCAYEKAFYVKGTNCAGMAVSWMEHEARQRGVRIHHSVCGHGEERMIAGYPVDGFCLEPKRCSSSTAAIGMAVQSAWCGFKIWRRLTTYVKLRRESAKWISRALLSGDCGLPDGQAQGVRFYYLLSGQVPPQV